MSYKLGEKFEQGIEQSREGEIPIEQKIVEERYNFFLLHNVKLDDKFRLSLFSEKVSNRKKEIENIREKEKERITRLFKAKTPPG